MDPGIPSRAIAAFERATGLRLCFHDLRRSLWPFTEPERNEHTNPVCGLVKKAGRHAACIAFDARGIKERATECRDGVVKRCHAGIVELFLPVFIDDRLEWLFFAGLRRAAPGLRIAVQDADHTAAGPWAPAVARLPTLDDDSAQHALELLRQLAARLTAWRMTLQQALPAVATRGAQPTTARRTAILWFLTKRHPESGLRLADLARHLDLSEDRAGHVVQEVCGASFSTLLADLRLRSACGLLTLSDLPLREVARQSGFANRGHFFAAFRNAMGTTPAVFRRRGGAG